MEEITAEYEAQELIAPAELQVKPFVTVACKTDLGRVRENNEDKYEFYIPENDATLAAKGMVFLVCDGMGGHAAGQIASELSCKTFIDVYLSHPASEADVAARSAVQAANRFVLDVGRAVPSRKGMGTTLSGLMVIQDRVLVAHVGDSRIYRLREGSLKQITTDHTWVEEQVSMGLLSPEEAVNHPYQHVLSRAVGTESTLDVDTFWLDAQEGDAYLLCSDGLINHVSDLEIEGILSANSPSAAAWKLVGAALVGGGSDNCTVLIVRIDRLERT